MVRETRYLWVGSLPESIAEDQICDHFSSYGKIQSVKLVPQLEPDDRPSAIVAFMDIKSASKAHNSENIISGVTVVTHYNESSAAVNTSARIQDCVNQKSVPPGACGQSQVSGGGASQQSLHSGRSQQRADGLSEDFAEARISDSVELRDAGKTSERSQGRGSGGESEKDRSRSSRPYHGSNNSYLPSHKSRLESHTVQGSKGSETTRRRNGKSFDGGGGGHRSSRTRSTSRSTGGRSQSQDSSGSGSQSLGQSGEKKLSSVVQLPGQASGSSMKSDDQQSDKPRGLLITGIPVRSSDSNVREGLFHDYKKYSRLMSITIEGQGESRCAVVSFKKHEDAAKALDDSKEKVFFGAKIIVTPHQGYEIDGSELHSTEVESNEFSHKATKTLYIGNLEKSTTKDYLRDIFSKFGFIIEVDIKSQGQVLSFGFVQFDNIRSVVTALRDMEDKYINGSKVKLGFGKPIPSDCVWVEGISDTVSEKYLATQFNKFGRVLTTYIDRRTGRALVYYDTQEQAVIAVNEMRGKYVAERKIQIDFASPDCRNIFLESLESSGQLRPGDRPDDRAARGCHPFASQEFLKQRPGYEGFPPRGGRYNGCEGHIRGSYNGSRDAYFPSVVNRVGTRTGCYETFPHDRRDGLNFRGTVPKYFESHSDVDPVFYDSYEVALKEYGHSRRDRESSPSLERHRSYRAGVGDSPRSSRYGSPGRERLDDTFTYRYGDGKTASTELGFEARKEGHAGAKPGHHGFSPANSDFSQKSKRHAHRDSRSISPVSVKQRGRKDRSSSPANKDGLWNSSTDEIGYHVSSRRASKESPDCYIYSEKPGKGSTYGKIYGHSGSRNSKSRSSRCDEDSDVMSDRDRSARGLDPVPRTKALRSVDEQGARLRAAAVPTDAERQKKLEMEISCNLIGYQVGDFSRDYGEEHQYCDGRPSKVDLPGAVHRHSASSQANQALTSGSTTPGSRTPLNNSDQDSAGGRNSHGSDEVMVLEKRKEQLLSLLKQIEEGDSDNNVQDDSKKEAKCIVVDDSDVEIDKSAEFRNNDAFYCNVDIPTERKISVSAFDSEQIQNEILAAHKTGKTKPIDTSKSFRKQMEEQRKSDLESLSSSSSPTSQTRPNRPTSMSCQEPMDTEDPYGVCNSPTEIPKDFVPAKCHNVSGDASSKSPAKHKRTYRQKLSDGSFNSSSEEELGEFSPSSSQHSRHWTVPDDVCEDAGVIEKSTRIVSLESLWSGDEMPKCHLPVFRRHPRRCSGDLQSEYLPCIIPDAPVMTKSSDGLGPQEPRKGISLCTREVLDLPLPKFAAEFLAAKSPASAVKTTTTPAVINKSVSVEISQKDSANKEPPVSPNLASSPAFDRNKASNAENDKISDSVAENTVHKLEVVSSGLGSCEPSGNTVNENKDDVIGGICPPSTGDPSEKCVSEASASLTFDAVTERVDSADGVAGTDDGIKISSDVANVVQEEAKLEEVSASAEKESEASEPVKADAAVEVESKGDSEQNDAKSESIQPDQKPDESTKDVSSAKDPECEDSRTATKQNASDSDISDLLSPTPSIPSLEERIRALDEKLNQMQQNSKPCIGEAAAAAATTAPPSNFDYREKYVRRRKEAPGRLPSQAENRNEVSAVARTLLSRTSIFDQDSHRLEQLQAKYDPSATSSGFARQPDAEPYSSLYTPLYRGAVGVGGKDGASTQSSSTPDGFVCSSPGMINPAIHSSVPSVAWNNSSCSGQQISMPTTWPSPMATTPSPLSVVISPNLPFGQLPTPSWMSPALPNQSGYGAVRGPTPESLPAGARMPIFFHQTSFEGSRAPGNTPPYSGGPNPSYQSHISGGDPRRLSRPDMCAVSPLMSSGILKRQSSHSSDVDLWSNVKPDPTAPAKSKEIISPVSILKRPIKEETPKDALFSTGDASLNSAAVDSTSVTVSGIKRKPDSAFGAEANFCEGKPGSQSKNLKFNQPTKCEAVMIKSEKAVEDKALEVKAHSSSSVIGQHGRICGEIKRTSSCSMGSPKPCPAKAEEKRSAELSGAKKWEDANKAQARKAPKPSVGGSQGGEKVDYAKKDCRARITSESSEAASVEPAAGNQSKDKLGKLVKTKAVGKDSLEKLDRDREKDKDKDKEQHKEKDKEKNVQDQGSDNRAKDKMHVKPKTPEVKAPFKAKDGKDDESKKECLTPLELNKDDGKKEKATSALKSGCGKERTMSVEFGKEDSKKLKPTNRDVSKESVKRTQSSGGDALPSAKSVTDSESKGHKAVKTKPEKPTSKQQQPKVGGDSLDTSIKNGKPSSSVKPGTNERRDSKDSNRSNRPPGQKTSNTNSVLKQSSSEHKSGSHGNKDRDKDGNKMAIKKRTSDSGKTERRSDSSKKKDKKVEKPKEKRPEEKREVKALMQKFLNSDSLSTGYVSMYDMVKRRSSKEGGGKDCFQSLDDRSKSLSQLQAKKNKRNRNKQSIGSSILDSDEDDSFRDDTLNLKSERSRKKPSTESRSKNWINSTSSSLSSDDEEIGKSSRVGDRSTALKSGKSLNDNSSSDVSIDEFSSLSAKTKTNSTKTSKPRQSIYTSSSESDSDMDMKFDKQVTSTPFLVKSKPVGDAGSGKSQKKGSELMGKKAKLFSRSKPISRSLQAFSPSDVDDDDDDIDDTDADDDSSIAAKLPNESQSKIEAVANVLEPTAALASKKRNLLSEVSVLKKNETEMDSSESTNKPKKVSKPAAITVKENTSPSKPRETLPSTKNEIKSKTKTTEGNKKDVSSIHHVETNDESSKKERHQETIVCPKEKDKSHSQSKSDAGQKRNLSDSKPSKSFDKAMASDSFDKTVKRQKQEISSRNDAPSKSESSLRNELERTNKAIRDSCEKLIKRPKLEMKSGGKSFEDEDGILTVAKSVVGKTTEKLETGAEDLNANLRSDNIFEKMEMKEEPGRIGISSETTMSVDKPSEGVSLGLEMQYSAISDTTTATLDEEDGSLTIPVREPVESSRPAVKEVDTAKMTVEKMKQDATKEETIAEAVKAIMDLGREELGRGEQRKASDHVHHEESVVAVVMDTVDHDTSGVSAGEANCPEVSSDDSDELTQAIQSLIGKELEPDVEEPVEEPVEEQEVQLEDVVSQPELDENKPEEVENNAVEVYSEALPECPVGGEFAENKAEIKHVQEENEINAPENVESLKETVKVEVLESSVTDATESKQSAAFETSSSVFVEPKPLVEKEEPMGGEKDSGDPDSLEVTEPQSKGTKVDPNKSIGDSAYFAGYFSPFPCVPIPKDEVEEQNSVVKVESTAKPETPVSKSPAFAAVTAADCGANALPEPTGKGNETTEVDLPKETCIEPVKKEEEPCENKNKDLYEFKDEEEKMITDFVPARPRKRSGEGEANGATVETPVRAKKPKLELADEPSISAVTSESPSRDDCRTTPASTSVAVGTSAAHAEAAQCMLSLSLATSVPKPVTDPTVVPALSLPVIATTTAPPPPLSWQTNMDKIIDEVAKGNFDRGCDFNYYNAKKPPRSKSREEPVPPVTPSGNLAVHPDLAKQHMIMAPPGFLQMPAAGGAGIPRSDTSSLHHLPFYNAGAAAARQLVSQPQIVMLSSDKTSPRLTSPLVQNQAPFRPQSTLYQALVSSAANVQQSGLLFCAPPVGYQLAPTGLAVSHSDSSVIPMHRFLGPRDDLPHSLHSSQVHQMTSTMSTRGADKLVNLPNQLRPGHEAQQQGMAMPRHGANLHGQQELGHPGARVMPTMMSHGVLLAHNPSSVSQNQTTHNEQHPLSIQQQAHLQVQQQQQHQQQKHSETMPVATSATPGQSHGRPEYLYRQVTPSSQVKFEGVPAALGIVSLEPGMFRQMSPKISDSLLQSLPRQPGALVAHFGNYPQSVQYGMMLPHASLSNTKDPSSSVPSSSSAQSELREALAQPSRLAQQEQLIQQQQQNVLQVRPHNLPDLCPSPVTLGQHRMPFAIQEPRSTLTSRAEPKAAGMVDSPAALPGGPPMSLIQPFCDPSAGSHTSSAETKPSGQQTYKTNPRFQMLQYDQGLARGIALDARQLEQLMLSKEVMSPQIVAQHHLMVAGQMQPPQQQQQQQPSMSLFSHPDLAVGRPPSVHHLPASSLSAQQGHIARPSPDHSESIAQLLTRFPVMWNGVLELKNDRAPVQMHFISGNRTLVPASLQDNGKPLHIGQRMRLEAAQLEQVLRRMMNESEYSMLVAVPCGPDPVTMMTAAHSLQNGFIRYLQEKQAAGIVNIYQPSTQQATYVIHIFPPCDFSMTNLSRFAQDIVQHTTDANFLLIIITTC